MSPGTLIKHHMTGGRIWKGRGEKVLCQIQNINLSVNTKELFNITVVLLLKFKIKSNVKVNSMLKNNMLFNNIINSIHNVNKVKL